MLTLAQIDVYKRTLQQHSWAEILFQRDSGDKPTLWH